MQCTGFSSLENYRVVVTLDVGGVELPELYTYPDASGIIALELSEPLHAYLTTLQSTSFPTLSQAFALDTLYNITLSYREEYGAPPTPQGDEGSAQYAMIYGGVDYRISEAAANGYFANISAVEPWASWWPHKRLVTRAMPNWLGVHNVGGSPELQMEIQCFDEDGVLVNFTQPPVFASVAMPVPSINKIGVFPIGPDQLALPDEVVSYRVRFKGSTSQVYSSWRTYIIDRVPKRIDRYLVCINVWGVPETIRATGRRTKQYSFSPLVVARPTPSTRSVRGTRAQVEHNQSATYVYRTGYLTAREVDVVAGLMGIGRFWELEGDEALQLVPLGLNNLGAQTDAANSYTLELEFERALPARNYSPRRDDIAQDISPYWLEPDGVTPWETPTDNWEIA